MGSTRLPSALSRVPVHECPVHPPAWPHLASPTEGLNVVMALPEAERSGGSFQGSRTEEQLLHFLLEASPPSPAPAGLIKQVSPSPPSGPVQRPSQAQAELWFISAAPAASLSRLVNRGSRWGWWRRGLLWAMSGLGASLVPVGISSHPHPPLLNPPTPHLENWVLLVLRGCEHMRACVCVSVCVQLSPSEVGSPFYSL